MNYIKPKKHLGQHFLTDNSIAERIVNCLSDSNDPVLEIGPGKGVLTDFLIKKKNVFLIELDKECIEFLINRYTEIKDQIFYEDFLRFDLTKINQERLAIIGNFPYNISSQIFFKVLDHKNIVTEVVCMLQKEVAQRIVSPPGNKDYGILSVLLQAYYNIEYMFSVKPGSFNPPPKVNSGVIKLKRNKNIELGCNEKLFKQIVKLSFNQRRKTLRNSLGTFGKENFTDDIFQKRPEQLHYTEFINITNLIAAFHK